MEKLNWYRLHCQIEMIKSASLDKEAGFTDSLIFAIMLFLGGQSLADSVSKASAKTGRPKQEIEMALKNIDLNKMRSMSDEDKKRYIDSLKGQSGSQSITKEQNKSTQQKPKPKDNSSIIEDLARTIYAEAEGETYRGKQAVASVIYNRANGNVSKMVPVVKAKSQFSCWNNGRPARGKGTAWEDSVKIATQLANGTFKAITNHTHYYNPDKANPKWAVGLKSERIGNHVFLTPS